MNNPDVLKAIIAGVVALATTIFTIKKKKTKTTPHKTKTKGAIPYNKGD